MSPARWNATVVDSPDSEPYAVVGDLVVAVRTPRSRDFVTVEVAPTSRSGEALSRPPGDFVSPRPFPCLDDPWRGAVEIGNTVAFRVAGAFYRLTLDRMSRSPAGLPWVTCDFHLERD
jgi:hypothetical protein